MSKLLTKLEYRIRQKIFLEFQKQADMEDIEYLLNNDGIPYTYEDIEGIYKIYYSECSWEYAVLGTMINAINKWYELKGEN